MVEQAAVNRLVASSSLAAGAKKVLTVLGLLALLVFVVTFENSEPASRKVVEVRSPYRC